MEKRNYAEITFVVSSFVMLCIFSAAFIYYILYKEILIYLIGLGFLSFLIGFFSRNKIDSGS